MELRDKVAMPNTALVGGVALTNWVGRQPQNGGKPRDVEVIHRRALRWVGREVSASPCSNSLVSLLDDPHIAIWAREFGLSHQVSALAALALLGNALMSGVDL